MHLKQYLRNRRGVASIECALGTMAMITASLLALDLYRLASTQTSALHAAITLGDTMSRPAQLDANSVHMLAEFLHQEQFPTLNAVFVVSAVYNDPENPMDPENPTASPIVLWTERVDLSSDDNENPTPNACDDANKISAAGQGGTANLPDEFTMSPAELVLVVESCVERTNTAWPGAVYTYYIVPSRNDHLAQELAGNLGLNLLDL